MQQSFSNGIFLLLGTNLGDRGKNLFRAKELLTNKAVAILTESSIYQTKAWGNTAQPDFLNQVIRIQTSRSPENLLETILTIELEMGRIRDEKWGPRLIDIDLLFYNDTIIQSERLNVPHAALHRRRFTLVPLAEIAPEFVHPLLDKKIDVLLAECEDVQAVKRLD